MTSACDRIARPMRLAILAVGPGSLCVVSPASAETRWSTSVSAGGSVETNPYLVNGGGTDGALTLDVQPWLQLLHDEVSTLDLSGNLSLRQYSRSANGTDISGSASMDVSRRLSPNFRVNGSARYFTSRNGINGGFAVVRPDDPAPPPNVLLPDISLAGTRTRTQSLSGNLGFGARLSPFDNINLNVSATKSTNDAAAGQDFTYLGGGVNYARTLSERLSATVSVTVNKSNYLRTRVGDGTVISPQAGIDARLGPKTTLSVSAGASFTSSEIGNGVTIKSTSISGQFRLCRLQERGSLCVVGAHSPQPTALGGVGSTTSVSVNYNKQMSAKDALSFNLGFNRSKNNTALIGPTQPQTYYNAEASWSRSFNPRFSAYLTPSYSRISGFSRSYDAFRLSAGLRYTFGAIS